MSKFTLEEADKWVRWDPNHETRAAVATLTEDVDASKLTAMFSSRIQFGTAGLRGPMGPGYLSMNDLVVIQTTQGLSQFLLKKIGPEAKEKGVIIGYDHRKLGSLSSLGFAHLSAAVLLSNGFKVYLLEEYVPTPFVAFGVLHFKCAAGLMMTASHNCKTDNGMKVYMSNGVQIIPPDDRCIAQYILNSRKPTQKYVTENLLQHENIQLVSETISKAYYCQMKQLSGRRNFPAESYPQIPIVYTAMHGVGSKWVAEGFEQFGLQPFSPVICQNDPDPEFPTVPFPNPEEHGALNEAIATATSLGINLIIANDPDADRLAAAELVPANDGTDGSEISSERWHLFTGNELGALLGYWQIKRWKESLANRLVEEHRYEERVAVISTVVSCRMLKRMAEIEGVEYYDTKTGFKWIGNKAIELKDQKVSVLFSFEEALGYCVGDMVADKDGVSAAAVFTEMAGELSRSGFTVHSHLQSLYKKYGHFISYNSYLTYGSNSGIIDDVFKRLRVEGPRGGHWTTCGGVKITAFKDYDSDYVEDDEIIRLNLWSSFTKKATMMTFEFANGCSFALRPSGTESKLKFYSGIAGNPTENKSKYELEKELKMFVDILINDMLQPELNDLTRH